MPQHRRKVRHMSNAQMWYVIIAGSIILLVAVMEIGGGK